MSNAITIDKSGRLVIPKSVRDRFRLTPGAILTLTEEDGRLVLTPETGFPAMVERGGRLVIDLGPTHPVDIDHLKARTTRLEDLIAYALIE
jgi:AbrB family looped-hinge helix DNA binding protein